MRNPGRPRWPHSASRLACLAFLALIAGCERGVGPPPTVPLEAANPELVALIDDLLGSVRSLPESAEMRGRLGMA